MLGLSSTKDFIPYEKQETKGNIIKYIKNIRICLFGEDSMRKAQ